MKMRETPRAQDKKPVDNNTLKKQLKKIPEVKEKFISQCPSQKLGEYCWMTMMLPQLSYSFSMVHSTLYTFIGIQTLVLATNYPSIYWNTACLIVNSQSIDETEEDEDVESEIEDVEDEAEENDDDETENAPPTKKKQRAIPYGKIASAVGKITQTGTTVALPDINKSTWTFSPDVENNVIRYGLNGISKVGEDVVKTIMAGRPYKSFEDFADRIKVSKPQMVNIIKSGAFDAFGERTAIMRQYIESVSGAKKRITLQNLKMLIDYDLIPNEFDMERRVFNFNKYLKKMKIGTEWYGLDNIAMNFYSANFDVDKLSAGASTESGFAIKQAAWDAIYKYHMDKLRPWVQKNANELLAQVNNRLTAELWDKYCSGNISKWEMDSVSFYSHEHELNDIDMERYELSHFNALSETPEIERFIPIKGKQVPILKLHRICGTVLDRDKAHKSVSLLTTDGVVTVKIFGAVFSQYDRQISERGADGKKHVIQKSAFSRGNKIIVCGVREDNSFRAKKYSRTPYHLIEVIDTVNNDGTFTTIERMGVES